MENGVAPFFVGGLGNQMFQLSAGYIVSEVRKCPLFIPKWTNTNNPHSQLIYTDTIFSGFGTIVPFENDRAELKSCLQYFKYQEHQGFSLHTGYKAWTPEDVKPPVYMLSYYQYYPAMQKFEGNIRKLFIEGLEGFTSHPCIQSINSSTSAFLHIRRGDYTNNPDVFYTIGMDYYTKALELLSILNPTIQKIYILTDEHQTVKQEPLFQSNMFELVEGLNELESMTLMAKCTGGAICANSTFSWWGAFLGAYGERKPVFVPAKWVKNNSPYECNLFPSEWYKL